ncbi:PUM-HD domain-containing protein [Aphelenchoides fujianensis]|nr:PUM-HD domain-containing protein [Aphelenchoides fujianensis]
MGHVFTNVTYNNYVPPPLPPAAPVTNNNNSFVTPKSKKRTNRANRSANSTFSPIDASEWEQSMLSELDLSKKSFFDVPDAPIVGRIVDSELSLEEIMEILQSATDRRAGRLLRLDEGLSVSTFHQTFDKDESFCGQLSDLILKSDVEVVYKIALNPIGNFLMQDMIGVNSDMDTFICNAFVKRMQMLTINKYGCRVVQTLLEKCEVQMVRLLVDAMLPTFVPDVFQTLVFQLLTHAQRFAVDKYANYLIQFFIAEPAFKRQRDYIIDQVVVGNILVLSQDKFGSHVVEASLANASPPYLEKLCEEIFSDYQILPRQRTPLEIMLFDQYGNYVVQRLLTVCVDVATGRRPGDHKWLHSLAETVERNRLALQRYSSGKKIINTLSIACPTFHK